MSGLRVSNLRGDTEGSSPTFPDGIIVSGVVTSTSFSGNLTGNVSGSISGTTATFSGDVSIGGTLTYEDVTNIDSVGVITARGGIEIGAGQSVSAVSGIITYYGDGSNLDGVESGVVNFVASGNIDNGATVVINTDGTVGIITQTTSNTPSAGTPQQYSTGLAIYSKACVYDPINNKVIVAYRVGNSDGRVIVGTVSGTSISFGSEVTFNSSGFAHYISMVYDSTNEKVVIAYLDGGNTSDGTAIVGTVSGNSISFGTKVVFETNNIDYITSAYDSTNGKVVIAYSDNGNGTRGTALVGTVSGNSISFGSKAVFFTPSTGFESCTYDSTNSKIVIAFRDQSDSNIGKAVVGTVSGTSISFGSAATYQSSEVNSISAAYDTSNQKVVVAYRDAGNSNVGKAVVGTVDFTSISFGTAVTFDSDNCSYIKISYDSTNGKVIISYMNNADQKGKFIVGTVSGTSISFGSPTVLSDDPIYYTDSTYDSTNDKTVVAFWDYDGTDNAATVVLSTTSLQTNLTTENYIGIAAESISNGSTGKINIVTGTNSGQTGLSTAQTYYVQPDGTLGTSAGSPSVVAGTAISDTTIIVQKS